MVTETSKEAYRSLNDLGDRQRLVHKTLSEMGIASNRDIARRLRMIPSDISGRMKELRDYGFVAEHGKKIDPETGKNVTTWCVIDPNDKNLINLTSDPSDDINGDKWAAVPWMDSDD